MGIVKVPTLPRHQGVEASGEILGAAWADAGILAHCCLHGLMTQVGLDIFGTGSCVDQERCTCCPKIMGPRCDAGGFACRVPDVTSPVAVAAVTAAAAEEDKSFRRL